MKKILVIIFIVVNACTSSKTVVEQKEKSNPSHNITIELTETENLNFKVKNNSDQPVYLYQPSKLVIEKYSVNRWESIKILNCPCDAPCNAPEEKYLLKAGGSYNIQWNKKLSWCGPRAEGVVRETITQPAKEGKYRLVLRLYEEGKLGKTIYKEFNLK